ncbi:cytochrome P450 [Streptomyces sp. LUP47B]|uniref:cytochrome P450 n=1 Tax=Streptomyces sp. LUP47B TaxID=1890286 RepID=UPI0008519F9E|nr:cytochrome P450 [Streptomyces sp. LUP47B]
MAAIAEIPGPKGLPLLGSALDLRRDSLDTLLRARREFGDVVRISAGPPGLRSVMHCVFSAEGAQQVLATQTANFRKDNRLYEEIRLSIGNGLLTSQDADYLRQRRLIQPLFTRRQVDGYAAAVTLEAGSMVGRWRTAGDTVVDVNREMDRFALRTVARILFGADIEAAADVVHDHFPVINAYVLRRGLSPVNPPRSWPLPANRRAEEATRAVYAVCDRIIAERRAAGTTAAADDLLSLLSRASSAEDGSLDAAELRDQLLVFLIAGHETTGTSMTFALHLLSLHPEVQARAQEEVDRLAAGRTPSAADLDRLPYLTRVLKEAMRLYPAAPLIGRRSVEAAEVDGHLIPAGADVLVPPWVIHRHPDLWEDPERFAPERFTPEREAARHHYAWFPFGGGPRACIGQHFAMLESVLALAVLLRAYDLEAVDRDISLMAGVTLQATGTARVRLRARAQAR